MGRPACSSLMVLLGVLAACTTAAGARRAERRRALDEARLSRPPAEIWPEVRRFLHQRGYPLVGDDRLAQGGPSTVRKLFAVGFQTRVHADGSRVLETDPLGETRTRVRVEALPVEGGSRLRVRLIRHAELSVYETTESGDDDLELALLEHLDPAVAARVTGRPLAAAPAGSDRWARVRPLLGSWTGSLADGTAVRWRFDFAGEARFVEMRGTPLLFAGSAARGDGEEMGRIAHAKEEDRLVWNQLTNAGRVDRYEAISTAATVDALVVVAPAPESLPTGARARLTFRRSGEALEVALDIALPGQDFVPTAAVRLRRAP